jgi:hypothetical protein
VLGKGGFGEAILCQASEDSTTFGLKVGELVVVKVGILSRTCCCTSLYSQKE